MTRTALTGGYSRVSSRPGPPTDELVLVPAGGSSSHSSSSGLTSRWAERRLGTQRGNEAARFEECVAALAAKGFDTDELRDAALLTPSCGTGSLDEAAARRVFELLRDVRQHLAG